MAFLTFKKRMLKLIFTGSHIINFPYNLDTTFSRKICSVYLIFLNMQACMQRIEKGNIGVLEPVTVKVPFFFFKLKNSRKNNKKRKKIKDKRGLQRPPPRFTRSDTTNKTN